MLLGFWWLATEEIFGGLDADGSGFLTKEEVAGVPLDVLPPNVLEHVSVDNMEDLFEMYLGKLARSIAWRIAGGRSFAASSRVAARHSATANRCVDQIRQEFALRNALKPPRERERG